VQRATAQSKTGFFRGYDEAEAPPGFQAGWSDCMYIMMSKQNEQKERKKEKIQIQQLT
jgi:hypothetical protein